MCRRAPARASLPQGASPWDAPDQAPPYADEDDSHIFHRAVGKKPLQVGLHKRERDAEERPCGPRASTAHPASAGTGSQPLKRSIP